MTRATRAVKKKEKEDDDPAPAQRSLRGKKAASDPVPVKKRADRKEDEGGQKKALKKGTQPSKTVEEETEAFPKFGSDKAKIDDNILKRLDVLQFGPRRDQKTYLKMIANSYVEKSVKQLTTTNYAGKFTRRITAITWHEKYPYALACASKFGDILFVSGVPNDPELRHECPVKFETKAEIKGGGAGYSVTAMKFHERDINLLYRAGIDCNVAREDLAHGSTTQFHNTGDYNRWFCALDLNFTRNMVQAGDNKGEVYNFDIDGKLRGTWRIHQSKVHHLEFSKKDPNLLVSASLDRKEAVKIWDIRNIKHSSTNRVSDYKPLTSLDHNSGLNCAKFSPIDGSRLMTSDQQDEIRVYQGPLWKDCVTIKHHHKQFQHITPVQADWHPVNDYIVVGRYPKASDVNQKHLTKAIEFFDSYSGKLVDLIYPPEDIICSLNVFNPTGEYLATGMNLKLILWKPGLSLDNLPSSKLPGDPGSKFPLSEATRNVLRGRRAREYSPAGSDDDNDDEDNAPKKKRSKTAASSGSTTETKTTNTKNPSKRKK